MQLNEKTVVFEKKQIALIDLDYFFAQCEIIRNPILRNKPVVIVVPTIRGSGAVATSNYEARALKIRSGMALSLAKKLSNDETVFINVDKEFYSGISKKVFEIIDFFCEKVEQASIDEAYLDLTNPQGFDKAEEICFEIKKRIKNDLGLTCSIGLSFNKLLAKMASEEKKPDGFTKILPEQKESFLLKKKVKAIYGIGPSAEKILKKINVEKIIDLRKVSIEKLIEFFGESKGTMFYNFSRGIDERIVLLNREKQQISRMMTLKNDSVLLDEMKNTIDLLCEIVFNESKKIGKSFRTCSIIVITPSFESLTKSKTFDGETNIQELKEIAYSLLKSFLEEYKKPVRRIGFRISNFDTDYGFQRKLCDFK